MLFHAYTTPPNFGVCASWKLLAKYFKILPWNEKWKEQVEFSYNSNSKIFEKSKRKQTI